ncbi:MAG: transposase, partial [Spirochaetes bacterium]|nr:transposase [Spirochaetota bacterium]
QTFFSLPLWTSPLSILIVLNFVSSFPGQAQLDEYKGLRRTFWGQHMWAHGYLAATTGNVTDDVVKKYIEEQDIMERGHDEDFNIEP